ncbi:MAG: hypothetical protein HY553_14640 [Elusimicrobia bacterium]|nr:hypothetical protein [Elusimicrobiota bacterium]
MSEIREAVSKRLRVNKDHAETLALWEELWAQYEEGGKDAVEEFLAELMNNRPDEDSA